MDRKHPAVQAAVFAYKKGFGALPVFLRSGGSIPVVNAFKESLGIPTVLMGFGLPDDRIHAPTRNFICQTSIAELRLQSGISPQPPALYCAGISRLPWPWKKRSGRYDH